MPTYELSLILKNLPRNELSAVLKRTSNYIFDQGGFIRKINNMGTQPTPFKIYVHKQTFLKGNYFIIEFDSSTRSITNLHDSMNRDIDILRNKIYKPTHEEDTVECKLNEEILSPMYRKEVLEWIKVGKMKQDSKNRRGGYKHNTGLDYNPFQR